MKIYSIYCITNRVTGLKYIGQTDDPDRRRRSHFVKPVGNTYISRSILKYGSAAFNFQVLAVGMNKTDVDEAERELIERLGTLAPGGYNLVGGGGGNTISEETRLRLSASLLVALKTPLAKKHRSEGQSARRAREASEGYKHPSLQPEAAARRRVQLAALRADPEVQKRRLEAMALAARTIEARRRKSISSKAAFRDPELRRRCVAIMHTPEARKKAAETLKRIYSNPAMRQARGDAIRKARAAKKIKELTSL